jgi:hypothetical protein
MPRIGSRNFEIETPPSFGASPNVLTAPFAPMSQYPRPVRSVAIPTNEQGAKAVFDFPTRAVIVALFVAGGALGIRYGVRSDEPAVEEGG